MLITGVIARQKKANDLTCNVCTPECQMSFAVGRSHHELVLMSTFAAIRVADENIFKTLLYLH